MTFKEYRDILEQRLADSMDVIRYHIDNGDEQALSYAIGQHDMIQKVLEEITSSDKGSFYKHEKH